MTRNTRQWVSASEVAAYVYCAESWRRGHGLGLRVQGQGRLRRGEQEHARWQRKERLTRWQMRLALGMMLVALCWLVILRWIGEPWM